MAVPTRPASSRRPPPPKVTRSGRIQGPKRPRGAPVLACNQWLEQQLIASPYPFHARELYRRWLAAYTRLKGHAPEDPKSSFRAALRSARRRLQRQRHH